MGGDIYITPDSFPTIGEWIQIVTTVLFSYLLWKAICESNRLNKNNLALQIKIKKDDDYYNKIRIEDALKALFTQLKLALKMRETYDEIDIPQQYRLISFENIHLSEWTKQYSRVLYSRKDGMEKELAKLIDLINQIEGWYKTTEDLVSSNEDTSLPTFEKNIEKLVQKLTNLSQDTHDILENIVREFE